MDLHSGSIQLFLQRLLLLLHLLDLALEALLLIEESVAILLRWRDAWLWPQFAIA
jgi:hypothetical protein